MGYLNLYARHVYDFEYTFGLSEITLGKQNLNHEENLEKCDYS